ncbi:MAG: aldo/keto reductase [Thermofilum sp.]
MEKKYFPKLGMSLPALGIGTWGIGGGFWSPDRSRDEEWIAILRRGIELGASLIDTAEMYGGGHSEELVGEAVKAFPREEVFIVTKVWPTHARYDDVLKSAEASMKRLGTHIDLYLIHWPPTDTPLCETMRALEAVVARGIARFIGVSNFSLELIEEARACLSREDVAAVENKFSLLDRGDEETVVPYTEREGMLYIAYSPLEEGELAKNRFLAQIGAKYRKTAAQVALNWLLRFPSVVPIPKAGSIWHLEENIGSAGWRLSDEDWRLISEQFRRLPA